MSLALAMDLSREQQLMALREDLLALTVKLHRHLGWPALGWVEDTLAELLAPRILASGLQDWVLLAALDILEDSCGELGMRPPCLTQAMGLLG